MPINAADQKFLKDWDDEIEREEADDHGLRKQALLDEKSARSQTRAALAQVSQKLLQAAGISEPEARKRATDDFERARKVAEAQRKRARVVLKSRVQFNDAEAKNLLAGVKRA